ncbi:MAG: PilZ domain-containing protein [Myxococcota bacterium]
MDTHATVAVFDGAVEFREALEGGLRRIGIDVHVAGTWKEARELLESGGVSPVLAIVDADLPGRPPEQAPEKLLQATNEMCAILISCDSAPGRKEIVARNRWNGVVGYLERQTELAELVFRVQAFLTGRLTTSYVSALRTRTLSPARLTPLEGDDRREKVGLVRNLSRTGILLSVVHPPAVGMKLDLSFRLPPRITPIECTGRVMWDEKDGPGTDGSGVGIEFDEMEADDAEAVTDFVLGKLRNSTGPIR